jgi:formylglycine-generating enzyme required for sulfatase activity
MNCLGETLTLHCIGQRKDNELTKESAMGMTQGILIGMLCGVVCLGCGKTNPPTGGASGEKASTGGSTKTDSVDRQPGEVMTNSIGMKLVYIQPGEFQMGSDDGQSNEKPIHTVKISKGFYIGIYEVTQEQYQKVMGTNPSYFKGSNLPVESVSWADAVEFCKKLSQTEGKTYRLPTEAEWEYACRAGTTTQFSFGDDKSQLGDYAWYDKNSGGKPHPVGTKKPNAWGLYDMHGNAWEWCLDWYAKDWYSKGPEENPLNESYGDKWGRVVRGGFWFVNSGLCRVSHRDGYGPSSRGGDGVGFRVVLDLK